MNIYNLVMGLLTLTLMVVVCWLYRLSFWAGFACGMGPGCLIGNGISGYLMRLKVVKRL